MKNKLCGEINEERQRERRVSLLVWNIELCFLLRSNACSAVLSFHIDK